MINLYGRFDGWLSHAMVSRGMAFGLERNGVDLSISNTFRHGGYEGLDEMKLYLPQGYQGNAPMGFYVGGYQHQSTPWLEGHKLTAALLIAESEVLPATWAPVRKLALLVAPSTWVRDAFCDSLRVRREVTMVVPHGLNPAYARPLDLPVRPSHNAQVFLHVCGAGDLLDRKGTPQLIEAWARLQPENSRLLIRTPDTPQIHQMVRAAGGADAGIVIDGHAPGQGLRPAQMRRYYAGENPCECPVDVVIQPSRAEAFGIVPLEARACGIPVIMTACSGHADHTSPVDRIIGHGASTPIAVQWIPNGSAPSVTVEAIMDAIKSYHLQRVVYGRAARVQAVGYYERWAWPVVCASLAERLLRLQRSVHVRPTIGGKVGF